MFGYWTVQYATDCCNWWDGKIFMQSQRYIQFCFHRSSAFLVITIIMLLSRLCIIDSSIGCYYLWYSLLFFSLMDHVRYKTTGLMLTSQPATTCSVRMHAIKHINRIHSQCLRVAMTPQRAKVHTVEQTHAYERTYMNKSGKYTPTVRSHCFQGCISTNSVNSQTKHKHTHTQQTTAANRMLVSQSQHTLSPAYFVSIGESACWSSSAQFVRRSLAWISFRRRCDAAAVLDAFRRRLSQPLRIVVSVVWKASASAYARSNLSISIEQAIRVKVKILRVSLSAVDS